MSLSLSYFLLCVCQSKTSQLTHSPLKMSWTVMEKNSLIENCFWGYSWGLVIPWARLFVLGRRREIFRLEGEVQVKAKEKFLESKPTGGDTRELQPQEWSGAGTNNSIYLNWDTAPIKGCGRDPGSDRNSESDLHSSWGLPLSSPSQHHPHWLYQP